jgi:hypothetical protein
MFRTDLLRKSKHTFCIQWLISENRAVNVVRLCRTEQATDDSMAHVYCMMGSWGKNTHTRTHTHTHTEYVILTVFPRKNWLHERALHVHCCSLKHIVLFCGHSLLLEGCRARPNLASRNWWVWDWNATVRKYGPDERRPWESEDVIERHLVPLRTGLPLQCCCWCLAAAAARSV